MENSIEEDVKNIEEIIELSKKEIDAKNENITAILDIEDLISLEHILSDYKRVLKENEQLSTEVNSLKEENEELEEINNELEAEKNEAIRRYNFETISKQKVKDKIEELKSNPLKIKQNDKYYFETHTYNKIIISVLQELIEESEK